MGRTKTCSGHMPSDEQLRLYLLEPSGPLVWPEIFGNQHSVEIEVGSGKGLFLASAASQFPGHNFLGIEIARKFARFCAAALAKRNMSNARIVRADARSVVSQWIADNSVSAVHVYFPDPWWKRRHKKRRIMTDWFVWQLARILQPHGVLRVASDVEEYFQLMHLLISQNLVFRLQEPQTTEPQDGFTYLTNFERKYREVGKAIFKAVYERLPGPLPAAELPCTPVG